MALARAFRDGNGMYRAGEPRQVSRVPGYRRPGDPGQLAAGTRTTPFTLINFFFDLMPAFRASFVIVLY